MKIKKFMCLMLSVALMLSLIACGNTDSADTDTGDEIKPVTLKVNLVLANTDPQYGWWEECFKEVEEKSNGTLVVEVYPSEALGKAADVIESIGKGSTAMMHCDPGQMADYVPDYSVFMAPYMIQSPEEIEKLWNSDLGKRLDTELEAKGIKVFTWCYFGTRNLLANKPVTSRADTKDMKIRCASTKMWNEVVRVLGGNPTNTAWSETYTALSQGVADGAESPPTLLYSAKLHEVCKYLNLTQHLVATTGIVMSADVYNSLPEDAKKALDEVGRAYPSKIMGKTIEYEQMYIDKLEEEGVTVVECDKKAFIEAAAETQNLFPEWTPGLYDEVNSILGR